MPVMDLMSDNFTPVSNGEAKETPTTFGDVVSSGFSMTRDNYNANSRSRLVSELNDERATLYQEITGSPLQASEYTQSNPILSLASSQDAGDAFSPMFTTGIFDKVLQPDLWGWAQRLHKDDTYTNLRIKELKEQDSEKYSGLMTNEEILETAQGKARATKADFENVASRATDDTAFYGGIIGSFGGAMTDPINVITMPIGASASSGILRAIGTEALIQAGVETAAQPTVFAWQKELGQEYDLGDAATNVMGAAVLGGAFTGVARGARPTAQATFALMQKSKTFNTAQKGASGYLSRVAHFREADPNPRVVDELHTNTVEVVDKVVRAGDNPSIADLPMTNKAFNQIDTVNTRGLSDVQKQTALDVEKFHKPSIDADAISIKSELDTAVQSSKLLQGEFSRQTGLITRIRQKGGISTTSGFSGELKDIFEGGTGAFTIKKGGAELDTLARELQDEGFITPRVGDEATPQDLLDALTSQVGRKVKSDELLAVENQLGVFARRGIDETSTVEDIDKIITAERAVVSDDVNSLVAQLNLGKTPKEIADEFDLNIDSLPSVLDEVPIPISNKETDELLGRLDSIDNSKAQTENFKQLVETEGNTVITLEDGTTTTLRQLQKGFDADKTFLEEISTCALG